MPKEGGFRSEEGTGAGGRDRADSEPTRLDRRTFIVAAAAFGADISTGGFGRALIGTAEAAESADVAAFRALSAFLTGAGDLDPDAAGRAFAQLSELDRSFARNAAALAGTVRSSGAADMEAFLATPAASASGTRVTMTTIVSSWYLGYTGTPVALRAEDDTGFVTYVDARMFMPTIDVTVRPTYARAGLNYWVAPPPGVTPPPAPAGITEWGRRSPQGVGPITLTASPPGLTPPPIGPGP